MWILDSQLIAAFIYFGKKIDRVIMLNEHQGFVKGLTWDPVGKYLASQVIYLLANLTEPSHFV